MPYKPTRVEGHSSGSVLHTLAAPLELIRLRDASPWSFSLVFVLPVAQYWPHGDFIRSLICRRPATPANPVSDRGTLGGLTRFLSEPVSSSLQVAEYKKDLADTPEQHWRVRQSVRNRSQIVDSKDGEMLERSIRHAWKAILAIRTKRCRNTSRRIQFSELRLADGP
jgi:hypothetical protein